MKNLGVAILAGVVTVLLLAAFGVAGYLFVENRRLANEVKLLREAQGEARETMDKARLESERNACSNQLKMLDGATAQWALEQKKGSDEVPQIQEILQFLPGGVPRCPAGGVYTIGSVKTLPTCSKGHKIIGL